MKNYTITVNGTPYNVTVEEGAGAPVAAAPVAAPAAAPAPAAPVEDEFKFTREWNMQFRERCEAKDKEAMEKKKEAPRKCSIILSTS